MDSSHHKVIGVAPAVAEGGRMCCVECRTTTTPMWRSGPTGPRTLCNACGIRYRKKRRQELDANVKHIAHTKQENICRNNHHEIIPAMPK
ncbi:hypothetical protein ZWY2020_058728 [Hordeum vulgare]|nr:hypothetical protein ZWY2020_058728 [Hordeum vulgare]